MGLGPTAGPMYIPVGTRTERGTAALRYELGGDHTYTFVEGVVAHSKAPGIENLATSDELCFAYYEPHCAESFHKAVADLERYLATDGPFDGVVAFSQGSSLATAILVDKSRMQRSGLRCGIFLSGRLPFVDAGSPGSPGRYVHTGESAPPGGSTDQRIDIPTAHIWGAKDEVEPGQGLALSMLCRREQRHEHVHGGGHEVPSARDKEDLVESANTIRRMLAQLRGPSLLQDSTPMDR
ncbi:hypothetical protein VMCG_10549 [Cytospora schulzeri]|uniref:Serine hydrolase domain-containing protein n=1 Tax=Cytospora schulzeri TaxID=448051 RepID=A0A423VAG2_9PEZI|nr:hypothetical protein VMCG_10549 [Valsa malicola]